MQNKTNSQVRIIAGKWRSRKITFPNKIHIRPTTDRIRETVFNWLTPYTQNANCLDAFAGSGVLSFESLSRGANHVTMIDYAKENIMAIKNMAEKLNCLDQISLITQDFFAVQNFSFAPFELIFLDPPFHQGWIEKSIQHLEKNNCLKKDSLIYIECEKEKPINLPKNFKCIKEKSTSTIRYALVM